MDFHWKKKVIEAEFGEPCLQPLIHRGIVQDKHQVPVWKVGKVNRFLGPMKLGIYKDHKLITINHLGKLK